MSEAPFDQANALRGRRCPKCGGRMELVWQGTERWRVSCMLNDMLEDDKPPSCSMDDVYGRTPEEAISKFDAASAIRASAG
jgi:hypothetical protein